MMEQLFEIAGHFEALAATIAALKITYRNDPAALARLDTAQERAKRGAMLVKEHLKVSESGRVSPKRAAQG